uniref:Uncharacterized protein n=1 Tax=Tetranychus urticae TaxID=32264 RepID=T1K1A6_TETUR
MVFILKVNMVLARSDYNDQS